MERNVSDSECNKPPVETGGECLSEFPGNNREFFSESVSKEVLKGGGRLLGIAGGMIGE